jgi:hypothetical protein
MRFIILICLCFVHLHFVSAQEKKSSFKLLVITPDSAWVAPQLTSMFETMEFILQQQFLRATAEHFEKTEVVKSKADKSRLEWEFDLTNTLYEKTKDIKFYQVISKFATVSIGEKTGLGPSSIAEVTLDKGKKRKLYDSLPFDKTWQYILQYSRLRGTKNGEEIKFSGIITLMQISSNQIILEKEFTGSGSIITKDWPCISQADCSIYDFINISSAAVIDAISNDLKK